MDAVTYALLNKKIKGLTSGIKSAVVQGTTITFTMNDGSQQVMTFPTPVDGKDGLDGKDGKDGKNGIGVKDIEINDDNELICTLSDGQRINAGKIIISSGGSVSLDNYYTKEETEDLVSEATTSTFLTEEEIRKIFAD